MQHRPYPDYSMQWSQWHVGDILGTCALHCLFQGLARVAQLLTLGIEEKERPTLVISRRRRIRLT